MITTLAAMATIGAFIEHDDAEINAILAPLEIRWQEPEYHISEESYYVDSAEDFYGLPMLRDGVVKILYVDGLMYCGDYGPAVVLGCARADDAVLMDVRPKIQAHEIGHILGLPHWTTDADNLMAPRIRDTVLYQHQRDAMLQSPLVEWDGETPYLDVIPVAIVRNWLYEWIQNKWTHSIYGDYNGDGAVDVSDFNLRFQQQQQTASIPEPGGFYGFLVAAVGFLLLQRGLHL